MPHIVSTGVSLVVILFFASYLALAPRNFHDLLVYQEAVSDWKNHVNVYHRFLTTSDPTGGSFAYPPLFLTVFYPFTTLPAFYLVLVWDALNLAFLLSSITLLVKLFLPEKKGYFILKTFALLLFSYPVLFTFQLGQTSLWVLFALSWTLFFYHKKKNVVASFPLVAVAFIKFFPAIFLLPFSGAKIWRPFILCSFFLFFITGLLFPGEAQTFVFQVLPHRIMPNSFPANQSLDAFLMRASNGVRNIPPLVAAPECVSIVSIILKCCGISIFLFLLLSKHITPTEKLILTILSFLLLSPIVWVHYYVLLIVPCLWFIKHTHDFIRLQNAFMRACFAVYYFSFICFSSSWLPHPVNIVLMSLPLYAVLIMYVTFTSHLLKRIFRSAAFTRCFFS